jgi:hypothetical protein
MTSDTKHPRAETVEEDAVPRALFWQTGGVAIVVAVVAVFVAAGLRHAWSRGEHASAPPKAAPDQLGIVEQTPILVTRRGLDLNAAQRESLRRYGWTDAAHRVAKLPIDEAMTLVTDPAFMQRAFARDGGE